MVQAFENAAFSSPVGRMVGPVETQFGYHAIEVTDRSDREVQIADFALRLTPIVGTLSRIEENLDDLKYVVEEEGNFRAEAERRDLAVQTVQVEADQSFVPGIGNSRALTNFLETAEVGDVSPVIELNEDFMVASVEGIQTEGHRPLREVRSEIEPRVRLEKKSAIQISKIEDASASSLSELADNTGVSVRSANGLTISNAVVPGLGREPRFVGTAFGLAEGQRSSPIEGQNNAFILEVTGITEPPDISPAEKERIRNQLLTQRRSVVRSQWLASLRDQAEITDNRRIFLQ
jgi:peptidylprolyl isomerase/peptidyl-prolyl cis-trans isomerase D